jgi:peroxiredoxin
MIFGLFLVTFTGMAQDVGDEAPDFSLTTLNGNSFTLSNYRGKVVFIFFFGYACPHCLANGNNTETGIYNIYKSYEEFEAVGVDTWNGNNSGVSSFASTTGITYTLCLQAGALEATYQTTYDRIVVVDKEGIIRYKSTANSVTSIVSDAAQVVPQVPIQQEI